MPSLKTLSSQPCRYPLGQLRSQSVPLAVHLASLIYRILDKKKKTIQQHHCLAKEEAREELLNRKEPGTFKGGVILLGTFFFSIILSLSSQEQQPQDYPQWLAVAPQPPMSQARLEK